MDWALDIDGSGIWIHVELAVGDLLRYVEKKFSGTFMVDSMTAAWQRSNVEESTVLFSVARNRGCTTQGSPISESFECFRLPDRQAIACSRYTSQQQVLWEFKPRKCRLHLRQTLPCRSTYKK